MFGMWALGHCFLNPPKLAVFNNSYRNMEPVRLGWFYMDGACDGCYYHLGEAWK